MSKDLDKLIKEALEKLENDNRSSDWDKFASQLDENPLTEFDEFVAGHLSGIEYSGGEAWDAFEDEYAIQNETSHSVDEIVKAPLENQVNTYNEDSWAKVLSYLNLIDRRERQIIIQKAAEISLFLILCFGIWPFFQAENPNKIAQQKSTPTAEFLTPNNNFIDNNFSDQQSLDQLERKTNSSELNTKTSTRKQEQGVQFGAPENDRNTSKENNDLIAAHRPTKKASKSGISTLADRSGTENKSSLDPIKSMQMKGIKTRNSSLELTAVEILEKTALLPYLKPEALNKKLILQPNLIKAQPNKEFYRESISIQVGLDVTRIQSPTYYYEENGVTKSVPSYTRSNAARSIGLTYEKYKPQFSYGIMASYSDITYQPAPVFDEIDRNLEGYNEFLTLSNIDFEQAHLEFFIRKYFNINERYTWFMHTSIGATGVIKSNYILDLVIEDNITGTTFTERFNKDLLEGENPLINQLSILHRNYHDGIAQGGSIGENLILVAQVGAGFQVKYKSNYHFFFHPSLRFNLLSKGIGPNEDVLHSLNMNFGIKKYF